MPSAPIPFNLSQETSSEELAGGSPVTVNVIVDGKGAVRRRPGLIRPVLIDNFKPMSSVFVTEGGRRYVVGSEPGLRTVYRELGGAVNDIGQLPGVSRPVFCETGNNVVMAGGATMSRIEIAADTVYSMPEAPNATHVVGNSSRLLANDPLVDRGIVRYSDTVGATSGPFAEFGYEHWVPHDPYTDPTDGSLLISTAGVFTAEAKPDRVVAIAEESNDIFVFGREILEVWSPQQSTETAGEWYARAIAREYGCSAPYSVVRVDNAFMWLDHARRMITGDGRNMTVVSDPIQAVLDSMTTVDDCYGFRVMTDPVDAVVWIFPTDGRALAYSPGQGWCQWMGWNLGTWAPLKITGHAFDPTTATDLVVTNDGYLAELSMSSGTDVGEQAIAASITTGFIDRGTSRRKRCRGVRVAMRRGSAASAGTVATLRFRDDLGPWSDPLQIELGTTGDTSPIVPLDGLGYYRTRQWKFDFTATESLSLVGVTEDFEELEM